MRLRDVLVALIGIACIAIAIGDVGAADDGYGTNQVLRVPADYSRIQEAIDEGNTVLISPGTYHEGSVVPGKSIKLLTEVAISNGNRAIYKTVLSSKSEERPTRADAQKSYSSKKTLAPTRRSTASPFVVATKESPAMRRLRFATTDASTMRTQSTTGGVACASTVTLSAIKTTVSRFACIHIAAKH